MMKQYKITIIWGTDGFGKWLAKYAAKHFSTYISELTVTGRSSEKWQQLIEEMRSESVRFMSDNIIAVQWADIVIYSVPISKTQEVIETTLPYIKPWAVVADVTSIKAFVSRTMQMRDDIVVIPTHPMFGPYIQTITGQVIVLTGDEKTKNTLSYQALKSYLSTERAKVVEVTPKEHDRMMAVVQWLTHLNMFVIGETMKRLNFHIGESMNFISPIYKIMISSVGRYLGQNPQLYADIQMHNEEVLEVHEAFLETAKNFHSSVSTKDATKFITDVEQAKNYIGTEYCEEGQRYTDKIIYMIGRQQEILKNNIWKKIFLRDISSWELIEGELEKYENRKIFLKSWDIYMIDQYEIIESNH